MQEELYHYTLSKNVASILREGLVPGKGESEYSPLINDPRNIWLDSFYYSPPSKGGSILVITISKLDPSRLSKVEWAEEWYIYSGIVPANAVELAETG